MDLERELNALKETYLVDYLGYADLSSAARFIEEQGGSLVAGYPSAVSIGIVLPSKVVDGLAERHLPSARIAYKGHAYEFVNQRLNQAASLAASIIRRAGYDAFPVASSDIVDQEKLIGLFSNKLAAHLAGLGWIGRSCLLVTPDHGPRVRWASVLTNAPLAGKHEGGRAGEGLAGAGVASEHESAGIPTADTATAGIGTGDNATAGVPAEGNATAGLMKSRCGECTACVDICPVHAFSGRDFNPSEPRELRYDARKCRGYFTAMRERGEVAICGMCLYVCPYGRPAH